MPAAQPFPEPDKVERADSRRKRLRLIAAARTAIAEDGLDVPSADIAARAEVGVGTLYRRFGTKEALIEAVLLDVMIMSVDAADEALAGSDPETNLENFMTALVEGWVANRGLSEFIATRSAYRSDALNGHSVALRDAMAKLTRRAQRAGVLRRDVTWRDLLAFVQAASSQVDALGIVGNDQQWRRTLGVLLDGLRSTAPRRLPGKPPADGPNAPIHD